MNIAVAVLVVALLTAVAVGAMLLVRRTAPDGGYFNDGDRAAGVFGVLATGFSVLLGFVVFLAFASFDASRTGAETEALTVAQQVETAQFLPEEVSGDLAGGLICYGRYVVGIEWPRLQDGTQGDEVNPWGVELFRGLQGVEPATASEQSAYDKWLDQTSSREEARLARVHGAEGIIPWPLWAVLVFAGLVIFGFMLFFADSGERAVVQGLLIGSVVAVMATLLLMIRFLDHPFQPGTGGLEPTAMQRTLVILEEELRGVGVRGPAQCDELGNPS